MHREGTSGSFGVEGSLRTAPHPGGPIARPDHRVYAPDTRALEASPFEAPDATTEEALRLWIVLARAYQTFTRVVSARVVERGLTIPQFGVLEALYHLGPLSLGELAEKLLVTGGNVTYVMDRLEEQGLVFRQRSELDRRVIEARLTPEGEAIIGKLFPEHAAYIRDLLDHLEAEEVTQLRDLLKKLGKGVARSARGADLEEGHPPLARGGEEG